VADLLAHSPPLPIIIYYGNPEPFDEKGNVEGIRLALQHRERVCRINLHLPFPSLREVFESMDGPFPALETLELYCSSRENKNARLPPTFEAPNLRHLQLSDFTFAPLQTNPPTAAICPQSLITFSLGAASSTEDWSPVLLAECLEAIPQIRCLQIGYLFPARGFRGVSKANEEVPTFLLSDLEELQFQGDSDYFEDLAARITAPSLKKLFITFINSYNHPSFEKLKRLIDESKNLRFKFARVKFKDDIFSIVMDHSELWTGRGAFELIFDMHSSWHTLDRNNDAVSKICDALDHMLPQVQSLLLDHVQAQGTRESSKWDTGPERKRVVMWHGLLRRFENVETLRVANRLVDELDRSLKPGARDKGSVGSLLPQLKTIVWYDPNPSSGSDDDDDDDDAADGSDDINPNADTGINDTNAIKPCNERFKAFVEARTAVSQPVEVVRSSKICLSLD
jgi:hypothetical protein